MDLSTFTLQRLQDSHDSLIDCVCLVGASLDDFNGRLTAEVDALRLIERVGNSARTKCGSENHNPCIGQHFSQPCFHARTRC